MATTQTISARSLEAAAGSAAGDRCLMVIFGASGDLTKRLLMPALYNLSCDGLLPAQFAIIGMAMDELTTDSFRAAHVAGHQAVQHPQGLRPGRVGQPVQAALLHPRQVRRRADLCQAARTGRQARRPVSDRRQHPLLPGHAAVGLRPDLGQPREGGVQEDAGLEADHRREAVRHTICPRPRSSTSRSCPTGTRARSTASTITWARRRCRTSWRSASPTACSSRSGTSSTSITSSSPCPNRSASKVAAATTIVPACCAT